MLGIFSTKEINTGRQKEMDYAKTIAILFMIIIHVWENLSIYNVVTEAPEGLWENILQFGAGPLAAPVFMFCLGAGVCYTRHSSPIQLARRGLLIFAGAYLLNLGRRGIWDYLLYEPTDIWDNGKVLYALLNGDILHFAGLAFLLIALFRALHLPVLLQGMIAAIMLYEGNILADGQPVYGLSRYFFGLFYYMSVCSFPLLQWFIYPAAGMIFGRVLRHISGKNGFYGLLLVLSAASLYYLDSLASSQGFYFRYIYLLQYDIYYQQEIFHFLYTVLVIFIELSLLYFLTKNIEGGLDELAFFIGRNLTAIYVIQWLLIGALYYYQWQTDNQGFDAAMSNAVGVLIVIVSVLLAKAKENLSGFFNR